MSTTRTFIDPEISGLMREILSNPRAKLFNSPNPRHLPGVTGMMTPVGQHQAGLIPAERHLLQVYRQEVAWLLRQAALTRIYEDPKKGRILRRSVTVDKTLALLDPNQISQRLSSVRATSDGSGIPNTEWEMLQLAAGCTGGLGDVGKLCASSMRLAPCDEVRIYLAVEMGIRSRTDEAVSLLQTVILASSSDLLVSYAWQNIGMLHAEARRPDRAFQAYLKAARTPEVRPVPAIASLHFAIRSRNSGGILSASKALDDLLPPTHTAVIEQCEAPTPPMLKHESKNMLAAVRENLGPTSRRITDVFFKE